MTEETLETGVDIRTYLRVINRRKYVIAASVIVLVGLTLAYCFLVKKVYTSTAQVLVPQQNATSALNPSANQQAPSPLNLQRTLADDMTFAQGQAVTSTAQKKLGTKAKVSVGTSATADVLTFTASSHVPAEAARIANAYARAYISRQKLSQAGQYTSEVASLHASIARLKAAAPYAVGTQRTADRQSITSLTQSLQGLQAASNVAATSGGTLVDRAIPPTSPSSPKTIEYGAVALVVGLVIGIGLAFLIDRLDDTIKSFDDIEESTGGLAVLGTIPLVEKWRKRSRTHLAMVEDSTSQASEAYRTLRTSVQFLSIDEPRKVIGITSAVPEEGKTTTVANLALSFARAGQRVVVMSLDFRKPKLHQFFGLENDKGVTSVLLGRNELKDVLQPVPGEARLRLLSSGPVPPNPAELLSLHQMVDLVDALSEAGDIVMIDCPPVLPVTDALLISRLVDGMLVLTRAKSTKKQDLRQTAQLLHQVKAPVLGIVINSVPHRGAYAYNYGYGYGYGYGRKYSSATSTEDIALVDAAMGTSLEGSHIGANGGQPRSHRTTTSEAQSNGQGNLPFPDDSVSVSEGDRSPEL